jgi:hypothetical protein
MKKRQRSRDRRRHRGHQHDVSWHGSVPTAGANNPPEPLLSRTEIAVAVVGDDEVEVPSPSMKLMDPAGRF